MSDPQKANRDALVPVIEKLKALDATGVSFQVLDDEGNTWRVEITRL